MSQIPESYWDAFAKMKGACILSTSDADGTPNSIYVGMLRREDEQIIIADSAFSKTRENLLRGSACSFLFITEDFKAYQAKCNANYVEDEASIASLKSWMPVTYSPKAALKLTIETIYSGAEQIHPCATKISTNNTTPTNHV